MYGEHSHRGCAGGAADAARCSSLDGSGRPGGSASADRGLWTMTETAAWLNVPERMVRRLVSERRIPYVKVGRYVRFRPLDVQEWRDGNVHPAVVIEKRGIFG